MRGKIDGYSGTKLFVREMIPENEAWMNDTLPVTNGEFIYRGRVESPRLVYFIPQDFQGRYELFLENARIKLQATQGDFRRVNVSGSKAHAEYVAVKQNAAPLLRAYAAYEQRRAEALKQQASWPDSSALWSQRLLAFLQQQKDWSQSVVLPYFANEWLQTEDITSMETFLAGLTGAARHSVYARYSARMLQQEKNVRPGHLAPDFVLRDTSGTAYRLSDYRGKYVLLEFSASWCGWCKLEIPSLKEVYQLTRGKDFVMFTINLDKERTAWVGDVARENLPWPVVSNLEAFDGPLTHDYNIRGIPVIYLIDPEGKIVTNQLRGKQMIEYIKKLEL